MALLLSVKQVNERTDNTNDEKLIYTEHANLKTSAQKLYTRARYAELGLNF